jgi:hypothetical protein
MESGFAPRDGNGMSEIAQRIASLSPEKLALLERRLKKQEADASSPIERDSSLSDKLSKDKSRDYTSMANPALSRIRSQDETKQTHSSAINSLSRGNEENLLANLDQLSDEEVDTLLGRMLAEEEAARMPAAASLTSTASPSRSEPRNNNGKTINRADSFNEEELLANLDQLSDEEVDMWLGRMLATEKAAGMSAASSSASTPVRSQSELSGHRSFDLAAQQKSHSRNAQVKEFSSLESSPASVQEPFEHAYFTYARILQKVWWDYQKRSGEAYLTYMRDMQEAWIDAQEQKSGEAYFTYMQSLQQAWMDAQKRFAEAYLSYLQALQSAWTLVDIEAIDPNSLWAISHSIGMAVSSASSTIASWGMAGR